MHECMRVCDVYVCVHVCVYMCVCIWHMIFFFLFLVRGGGGGVRVVCETMRYIDVEHTHATQTLP